MNITYIPMVHRFIYHAALLDWLTRRVLAWRVSIVLETSFYRRVGRGSHKARRTSPFGACDP